MKKQLFGLMTILTILGACQKNDVTSLSEAETIHATIEDNDATKTVMDESNKILWSENDQVISFMKSSYGHKYQVKTQFVGKSYADFFLVSSGNDSDLSASNKWEHNVVYYPYSDVVECLKSGDHYVLDVVLPSEQTYVPDSFSSGSMVMVAVSEDNNFTFKNVLGGIKLQLKGTQKVTSIKIEGKNNEKLSGQGVVTAYADETKPVITMASDAFASVTLNCGTGVQLNESTPTEFIIALPALLFNQGFTVTVSDTESQTYTVDTHKSNIILRSSLLVMPEVTLESADPPLNDNLSTTVVALEKPGTMRKLLGDNYLDIKSLKIVGPINGDDIYFLRKMLGGNNFNQEDWGKLKKLDLSESSIVEGGDWYYENTFNGNYSHYYTSDNTIGEYMFFKCANLQEILLPDTVTSIEAYAFQSCPSFISINIPEGLTSIGASPFYDCPFLKSVHITDLSAWCNISHTDVGSNPLINGAKLYLNNQELTKLVIPDNITEIKRYVFSFASFTEITINKSLISIGEYAFSDCNSLSMIEIPDNVKTIEDGAFVSCQSLNKVIVGNGVTSIGKAAFSSCPVLKEVVLGNNVTTLGHYAFSGCISLQSINIPENVSSINSRLFHGCSSLSFISIPETVTSIGAAAFSDCSSLTEIALGSGVTSIELQAFKNCSSLVSIDLSEGVTIINPETFFGCSSLTTITIGSDVTSIDINAFANCGAIRDFYSYAKTPPKIKYSFDTYDDKTTLHIPIRSSSKYKSSDWANHFKKIKEID